MPDENPETPPQPSSFTTEAGPAIAGEGTLADAVLAKVKKEIAKPGSVVCLAKCVEMVKLLTDDERQASVDEITEQVLKDMFLTTRVLTVANSVYYNRSGRPISTVSQAILVLGLAQIRSIVFSVLIIEKLPDQERAAAIRNRTVSSAFGGSVARGMSEQLKLNLSESAFLAGAFSQFGKLLVYSYLPDMAACYEALLAQPGADDADAARQVFGMRIEKLGKEIGTYLKLPPALVAHMDPIEPDPASPADNKLASITRASFEICKVAETATAPDQVHAMLQASGLFAEGPLAQLDIGRLFHESVQTIREVYTPATGAPLFKKLDSFSKVLAPGRIADVLPPPPQPAGPADIFRDGVATVTELVGRSSSSMRTILSAICETLFFGLRARNVVIAIRTQTKNAIAGEIGIGEHAAAIQKNFLVSLNQNTPQITSAALLSNKDIYIDNPASSKLRPGIPSWILDAAPSSILLIPVVSESNRYALIYADSPAVVAGGRLPPEIGHEIEKLKRFIVWIMTKYGRD